MIKILIADDHPIVRRGIKQILSEEPDLAVLGEAENGQQVLDLLREREWDVVVLDINMPGGSGLETLRELKVRRPNLPVLVVSIHSEEQFGVRSLKAGAAGYLTKESAPEELVKAIRRVHAGGKYIRSTLGERLVSALQHDSNQPPHESLSNREYEVLRLIASGKTVGEIANELTISVKTVSTHRARVLEKMGLRTNAELMHYAMQHRLVDSPN